MTNQTNPKSTLLAISVVILAALSRLLPHPPNFTAIGALAFFSGCYVLDRRLTFIVPLAVMFLTDLFLGVHSGMIPVYICVAFTTYLGFRTGGAPKFLGGIGSVLLGSLVFYLFTNLPVFYPGSYPNTVEGLLQSYTAALPFFRNQIAGDLLFTVALFAMFSFLKNNVFRLAD